MSLFFTGDTGDECFTWFSAELEGIEFADKDILIAAQVDVIMESKNHPRPYPEFLPNSRGGVDEHCGKKPQVRRLNEESPGH
jgi:hypothetical protein